MSTKTGVKTLESMSQAVWYNRWTLKKFESFLSGDILEVGCGIGNFTQEVTRFGKVFAIDIDKGHIEETAVLLDDRGESGFGDIEKGEYFFKKREFDSVVCINVLEHIKNDEPALKNIYSLLKKEGYLILLVPAHKFLYGEIDKSIGHFRRYDKKVLVTILQSSGFQIENCRTLNMIGAIGWFVSGRILKNKTVDQSKIKLFNLLSPIFLRIEDLINPPFGTSYLIIAKKK